MTATHLFTYGSLMFPQVWCRVVGGDYVAREGTLRGFQRRRIRGETYPALVASDPEAEVVGVVYLDLSGPDLAVLDHFEGEGRDYARIRVPVELEDGVTLEAWTYLYLHPDRVEPTSWRPERFERAELGLFLSTYCRARIPGRTK